MLKQIRLQSGAQKLLLAAILLGTAFTLVGRSLPVSAAQLTSRSIQVSTPLPSATSVHTFQFTITGVTSIGSISFQYCSNNPLVGTPCTAPSGFDALAATLASQSGETGFSIHANTTANRLVLSRAASITTPGVSRYQFSNITNPSTPQSSVYVRVETFSSTDGTGANTDSGGLAWSTAGDLAVNAFVPPYLTFCSGVTVNAACTSVNGVYLNFGTLSSLAPGTAASQMAAFTNDETGYVITVLGSGMASGINVISSLLVPSASDPGTSQFGINLRANTDPVIGQDSSGTGTGTPAAGYNTVNNFKFVSGDTLATSPLPTESNLFTVSYLANIPTNQPGGVYSTTLTYIATAQF